MGLSDAENAIYQNILKYAAELSLNLMAVKVTERPEDFLGWCHEFLRLCQDELNYDLLDDVQLPPLKKLQDILKHAISVTQLKMLRIAPWPIFHGFIEQNIEHQAVKERLRLLRHIGDLHGTALADMVSPDKLAFSGKHTAIHDPSVYSFDVEWFASTKGAKVFHQLLETSPELFDQALAHIPNEGDVEYSQYQAFADAYQAIFAQYTVDKPQGEKAPLAAASRLLAMKRPDQFIALTNAKIDALCQGFSIAKFNGFDFDSYWHELIASVRTCAWWHQAEPMVDGENTTELEIWRARALFVDVFFFAEKDAALHSNYLKARDKALGKQSQSKVVRTKRTKETAEMLVDRVLANDELPAYLHEKRDSIINQVKEGKNVDHVIGLMRAIFG